MSEGYLAVATGDRKYFAQAATLARSIRFFDPVRQICLACDSDDLVSAEERTLFDSLVRLPAVGTLRGTEFHLYLDGVSPFERTLYVDSDCLVANKSIHVCWDSLRDYSVAFCGVKLTEGLWRRGVDAGRLRRMFSLDHIVKLSGGVFYFDRSEASHEFFAIAQDLFETRREEMSVKHGTAGG